jgi:siroheme synthase-like protein
VSGIPILVEAASLEVLVVGGGAVAARKAGALSSGGARVRVIAPVVGDAMRALADAGRVALLERSYESGDVGEADLVIAATDHRATNAAVAAEARTAHRLVNVADVASEGSFAVMAAHRSGGLTVGVSAGVPAAAASIRDAIAARFDARYARALDALSSMRDTLLADGGAARWRELSSDLLGAGFCDAVDEGTFEARLARWR